MGTRSSSSATTGDELFVFVIDRDFQAFLTVDSLLILGLLGLAILTTLAYLIRLGTGRWRRLEIDSARLGLGKQSITLRPNATDRQIAYKLWVELSTRKIGLPIDLNDDVVAEIYSSWYEFFSVTRQLVKDVPVSKLRRSDTQKVIRLSIDVLNVGLRPHLTKWQARFRHWYRNAVDRNATSDLSPQQIQQTFPHYEELKIDLEAVNERLIDYRDKMYELAIT